ncbi:hypothetical protein [Niastella populi]|uniref:Uncharacterized protein n=1 Tax=Niastella populi TaxID=550983 RepID=A0A1V9ESD9_9BACT|nr:hypothetical protein [Niastella populi]OQP49067.1 hypothetical protein A4R26_31120 [Niastella populi]
MHPNQSLKRIYRELLEGNPTKAHPGNGTRNRPFAHCLTIQWPDGRRMVFYYAYLLSVELLIEADYNVMILRFTSQKITLKGYGLDSLCEQFADEKPDRIMIHDPRYVSAGIVGHMAVIDAIVDPPGK